MSTAESNEISEVMARVKNWSTPARIALAKRILESLEGSKAPKPRRGRPVKELIGLGSGSGPPPDDATVRQWIDEHRMEKYGP